MSASACPCCGAPLAGAYCSACGQRAPQPDDFTLRRFLRAAARELGDGDSRTLRTVRHTLVPGALTAGFLDYGWKRYLPPLRWYLILSGVFFLLAWDIYYDLQAEQIASAPDFPPEFRAAMEDPDIADRASDVTALLRFVGVLLLGLWVALLQWRRRPLGAHLVFAVHYYCADYLLFTLAAPLMLWLPMLDMAELKGPVVLLVTLALGLWAVLAVRRVYRRGWPASVLAGLAVLAVDLVLSSLAGSFGLGIAAGLERGGG